MLSMKGGTTLITSIFLQSLTTVVSTLLRDEGHPMIHICASSACFITTLQRDTNACIIILSKISICGFRIWVSPFLMFAPMSTVETSDTGNI